MEHGIDEAWPKYNMIGLIIVGSIYFILLDFLSFIFSIRLCGTISSQTSDNFECGFYSILTSSLRYRFNYWMIIIHFLIFEQELILCLLWFLGTSIVLTSNNLCCLLLGILFMEVVLILLEWNRTTLSWSIEFLIGLILIDPIYFIFIIFFFIFYFLFYIFYFSFLFLFFIIFYYFLFILSFLYLLFYSLFLFSLFFIYVIFIFYLLFFFSFLFYIFIYYFLFYIIFYIFILYFFILYYFLYFYFILFFIFLFYIFLFTFFLFYLYYFYFFYLFFIFIIFIYSSFLLFFFLYFFLCYFFIYFILFLFILFFIYFFSFIIFDFSLFYILFYFYYFILFFYVIFLYILFYFLYYIFILFLFFIYFFSLMPFPLLSGLSSSCFLLDNGNQGFIILVLLLYPLIYWIGGIESSSSTLLYFILFSLILVILLFVLVSLWYFFVIFEWLVIILFFILFLLMPSFYRIRTAFVFLLFTLLGSISLVISLLIIILSNRWMYSLMILIPFCIKIPSFPFYYWLPEVHCEANSSISILLAGLLLKLGIFGIMRFILSSFFLPLRFLCSLILSLLLIGIILVSCSIYRYYDLKKMIAFSSILHLNLSFASIVCMNGIGVLCSLLTSIAHSFSSSGLFLFVGLLINKTYSRYWDSFFFIDPITRLLLLFFILVNLSFAVSMNFVGEMFALIGLYSIDIIWLVSYLWSCFLSTFFWFRILNRKLPYHSCYSSLSLNYIEYTILSWLLFMNYFCGVGFLLGLLGFLFTLLFFYLIYLFLWSWFSFLFIFFTFGFFILLCYFLFFKLWIELDLVERCFELDWIELIFILFE